MFRLLIDSPCHFFICGDEWLFESYVFLSAESYFFLSERSLRKFGFACRYACLANAVFT